MFSCKLHETLAKHLPQLLLALSPFLATRNIKFDQVQSNWQDNKTDSSKSVFCIVADS